MALCVVIKDERNVQSFHLQYLSCGCMLINYSNKFVSGELYKFHGAWYFQFHIGDGFNVIGSLKFKGKLAKGPS